MCKNALLAILLYLGTDCILDVKSSFFGVPLIQQIPLLSSVKFEIPLLFSVHESLICLPSFQLTSYLQISFVFPLFLFCFHQPLSFLVLLSVIFSLFACVCCLCYLLKKYFQLCRYFAERSLICFDSCSFVSSPEFVLHRSNIH